MLFCCTCEADDQSMVIGAANNNHPLRHDVFKYYRVLLHLELVFFLVRRKMSG
jgi:hypothetical protein